MNLKKLREDLADEQSKIRASSFTSAFAASEFKEEYQECIDLIDQGAPQSKIYETLEWYGLTHLVGVGQ